jgi:hypothetical protein
MIMKAVLISIIVLIVVVGLYMFLYPRAVPTQPVSQTFSVEELMQKKPYVAAACKLGGCSAQACTDIDAEDVVSSCEWRSPYACYHIGRCEVQASGRCGWSESDELRSCLSTVQ